MKSSGKLGRDISHTHPGQWADDNVADSVRQDARKRWERCEPHNWRLPERLK